MLTGVSRRPTSCALPSVERGDVDGVGRQADTDGPGRNGDAVGGDRHARVLILAFQGVDERAVGPFTAAGRQATEHDVDRATGVALLEEHEPVAVAVDSGDRVSVVADL